jgi:beta-lactamase superfamily II metal-dependent hydrolase
MPTRATTVEVRMYNVGFGDAFRVIVRRGTQTWRMLVDCGVHSHGDSRPISESVTNIIADLADDCGGPPQLDVVVATHHHADHICGFAEDAWETVKVDEVWVPFVEDPDDAAAKALRRAQALTAQKLAALIGARQKRLAADDTKAAEILGAAMAFAVNSGRNQIAADRLLGRAEGRTFATKPTVRYLPEERRTQNRIEIDKCGVVAHILGPPRDPQMVKKMHPPKSAGWLTLHLDEDDPGAGVVGTAFPLFNRNFVISDSAAVPSALVEANRRLELDTLTNDVGLLAAASILERSVNNTSLFFVLDVDGTRLLFPGDAQHGAWEHVRSDPKSLDLIKSVDFYKVGHHGSHNATPKAFVEHEWEVPGDAMVPWGLVKQWEKTIPKKELIDALKAKHHRVIRPDKVIGRTPAGQPKAELVRTKWWSQLTFTA